MKKTSYTGEERGLNRADRRDRRRQKRENNEHIIAPLDNGKVLPRLTENIPLVPKNAKQSFLISCIHHSTIIIDAQLLAQLVVQSLHGLPHCMEQ